MTTQDDGSLNLPQTMKAWRLVSPGPLEQVLHLENAVPSPSPQLKSGEILIQVAWASLNPADYKIPEMGIAGRAISPFPKTPGMDLSGYVVAAAPDAHDVKPGDAVLARVSPNVAQGPLSQYVVVPGDGYAKLAPVTDMDQAAGAPTAALTSYQAIVPFVQAGDKIFINGGSGGTGTFAIQIAKILGCHVTVSCSTPKIDLCRRLGADEIIDYKKEDVVEKLKEKGQVFKLVVDTVGHTPANLYESSEHCLVQNGTFTLIGLNVTALVKGLVLPKFLGGGKRKLVSILTKNSQKELAQISEWMDQGKLETVIDSTYEFDEALAAYQHLKVGSSAGKVVVRVGDI